MIPDSRPAARSPVARGRLVCQAIVLATLFSLGPIPAARAQQPAVPGSTTAQAGTPVDVRDELITPLGSAQDLLREGKPAQALEQLKAADKVADKSPIEVYVIERMRAAAYSATGDLERAAVSIEAALASGQTPGIEQPGLIDALIAVNYNNKRYKAAADWAMRFLDLAGAPAPRKPQVRLILAQSLYLAGEFGAAAAQLQGLIRAAQDAGQKPPQAQLDLFASCFIQLKDDMGYLSALEQLVTWYPKKDYWADLLARLERVPGFSEKLSIDLFRLQFAAGAFIEANDYLELAQLALKAGFHAEARRVLQSGFDAGLLGKGADGDKHRRYLQQVGERADDELKRLNVTPPPAPPEGGDAMFALGYQYTTHGLNAPGMALMQQALDRGDLSDLNAARLRLATAMYQSGEKARARELFKRVEDAKLNDGASDLARLWGLLTRP